MVFNSVALKKIKKFIYITAIGLKKLFCNNNTDTNVSGIHTYG